MIPDAMAKGSYMVLRSSGSYRAGFCTLAAWVSVCVWLKFISVDYLAAAALDWEMFGSRAVPALRFLARALAVSPSSLGAVLCFILPLALLPRRARVPALFAADVLLSLLALSDRLFIRYYADVFILRDILLASQTGPVARSILSLLRFGDFLLFADMFVFAFLFRSGRLRSDPAVSRKGRLALAAVFAAAVLIQYAASAHIKACRPNIIDAMYDRLSVCAWISVPAYHWWDAADIARGLLHAESAPPGAAEEIAEWFASRAASPAQRSRADNLIVIQCEALQYFAVGLEIGGEEVCPNLNRFADECIFFPRVWCQTASGNSADAEFMANTGLFPSRSGAAYTLYDGNFYNSLARAMNSRGALSFSVQGTSPAFWNRYKMHGRLGFMRQYGKETFRREEVIGLGLSDAAIFSRSLEAIDDADGPFYAFIVTLTSHHPFNFPGIPEDSLALPDWLEGTLTGNYLLSLKYFDSQLGIFIEGLRSRGLLDNSLIVLYGDHPAIPPANRKELAELLGEDLSSPEKWRRTRRVPLMFRLPDGERAPSVSACNAGQIDILPTISGLMGLGIETAFGRNLLYSGEEPVVFRSGSFVSGGVYVDPASASASYVGTGEKADYSGYGCEAEYAARVLRYNDLILEYDLIRRINEALKQRAHEDSPPLLP